MQEPLLKPFVLVGGTALALHLGHRRSRDLDLFSDGPTPIDGEIKDLLISKYEMRADGALQRMRAQEPEWDKAAIQGVIGQVKTDVVNYGFPLLRPAVLYPGSNIRMASLEDLGAMKLAGVVMSGERLRDFVDVAALSEKLTLNQMRQAYEGRFNTSSSEVPRALAFHGDIDFNMKPEMQGYRWPAIATRLEQMQRNPDRLFPPIVEQRLLMPVMEQLREVNKQKAPGPKLRGPKL
ncbi:nucleotidyl transferase AbiEii/AbiGii toxin family protein [Hymenobacter properus]|uniref:Nucleotidyl transferase AbiEii/AbiGii toxin family protein n=1 Tax=Hymenobacter properus TaxID=2791026 RepID=A0A931FNN1_9BACT|nr:nucleotidyl transferase AbiEii/AbiGii toxin family protein [Hymenobacter properus]MBF9144331.1 nucleotidyl transferase AbiEii/AbiGii toxin family protein [Hymenobacter properus]MBR7723149.1 nucleotidyl transferase AbiEii/AbiGii toxin family protein [Microvirga sp. SRT04]